MEEYYKFEDLNELRGFMREQCGRGESDRCSNLGSCQHYDHLLTSKSTGFTVKHWSCDVFFRDDKGKAYCEKRNQPLEAPKSADLKS